ncbi:E3 ubiquitin-protein ligase UPL5 isoform X2 [Macadamia integrifolia]|uniref:E3 ubiquitin-protein ligase UPL5 isoform X2 n=1 Tax=Macadamia integrifolia TaxID=60698 RepID=UPI001C4FCAD2|nr:E3 ubiquitin-protein ligase UPL5 isoform X2 [Macadamia integrifolia]
MSFRENSIDCVHQRHDRISSKRKLDDYGASEEDSSDLLRRMKKDEADAVNSSAGMDARLGYITTSVGGGNESDFSDASSVSCNCSTDAGVGSSVYRLQFFVRPFSGGNTIIIHASPDDSVKSVHEQIRKITGIPIIEQRLIYRGKQLQWEQSLAECGIQNDAGLQLVGRMRSTEYPRTWQVVNDLVSAICRLCREEAPQPPRSYRYVKARVEEFLRMTPNDDYEMASGHIQIFKSAGAPTALVMLFLSPIEGNKQCAEGAIRPFLTPNVESLPKSVQAHCASIVLEFCKLLTRTSREDPLYISCRNTLGSLLENLPVAHESIYFGNEKAFVVIREFYPFVRELANRLSAGLELSMKSSQCVILSVSDVRDLSAFLLPLRRAIEDQMIGDGKRITLLEGDSKSLFCGGEIELLHNIFLELLERIDQCLITVEWFLAMKVGCESEGRQFVWSQYLAILKELNSISKLYDGAEDKIRSVMMSRRSSLNTLIRYTKRYDDHRWFLEHKDVTDFESRRHLAMMMFPEVKDEYEELHEMLIDRSQLLAESFEYIKNADSEALHGGLFMEFKNEEATGPGVLREWFCLVCQAIFNPQNALFLACPNDRRRFFPNPDPCFYSSCKMILEMDANFLDSDALGLTFVREIEELGSRRVVELCPGGKGIVVNSRNRERYVNHLIEHRFVTSISEQVAHFAQGFADILCDSKLCKFFFESLELEDFDRILHGSGKAICVKDWEAHTEYNGYKETERQICWFWKVVEEMSAEQLRVLLFFWTSLKYLPVEGFSGLTSRLYIYKTTESHDHLPSSHTCFYRLCLPPYPSLAIMRDRLNIITQEHVSCSFGMW